MKQGGECFRTDTGELYIHIKSFKVWNRWFNVIERKLKVDGELDVLALDAYKVHGLEEEHEG